MRIPLQLRPWLVLLCVSYFAACNRQEKAPLAAQPFTASAVTDTDRDPHDATSLSDAATTVYVCKSAGAKKYHLNQNCHALKRCTHEVVQMKVKEAEGRGLGLCGFED